MHKWCAGRSARWSVFANGIDASTWSRFHRRQVYGLQMCNLGTGANYTSPQCAKCARRQFWLRLTHPSKLSPNRFRTSLPSRSPRTSRRVRISSKSERWHLCMPSQRSKEMPLASRAALILKRNVSRRNEDMSQGHPPLGIDRPPRPRCRPLKTPKRNPCSRSILSFAHIYPVLAFHHRRTVWQNDNGPLATYAI